MKKHLHTVFRKGYAAGYTLVEVLVVVGLIGMASAGVFLVINNVSQDTTDTKLLRDVTTINRAIGVYQASGGDLNGLTDPQAVLDRLKATLADNDAKKMAGLRGSLIDTRLKAVAQNAAQAASNQQRAYWNGGTRAFYLANAGASGIKEFALDEALATVDYGNDVRNSAFKLATVKPWVWDTLETTAAPRSLPRQNTTTNSTPTPPGNPGGPLALRPPTFSRSGGEYPLTDFPLELTLSNPNPPNTSNILFSVSGSGWTVYTQKLTVNPQDTIPAMAGTLIPDQFSDSPIVRQTYTTKPVTPEFDLSFDQGSYSYVDLGGLLMPDNTAGGGAPPYGRLRLTNGAAIPDLYESSTYFQTKWTKDGSNPLTSTAATVGPIFSNGFTEQQVPVALTDFGQNTSLTIKAGAITKNPAVFNNSAVVEKTVNLQVIKLRPPLITINERDVTLNFDFSQMDVPQGAYIQYTTDASDPGVKDDAPTGGLRYAGTFKLDGGAGSSVTITARVYPPPTYLAWFDASDSASETIKLPMATEFYVGGLFLLPNGVNGSGGPMRNIARLAGNGSVDPSFDVGAGTNANSLVGVIRQVSAGFVFAGGDFETVNNVARPAVVRLNANGSVDSSFDAALAGGK